MKKATTKRASVGSRWVKGEVRIVKKGRKRVVQFRASSSRPNPKPKPRKRAAAKKRPRKRARR